MSSSSSSSASMKCALIFNSIAVVLKWYFKCFVVFEFCFLNYWKIMLFKFVSSASLILKKTNIP